MKNVKLGFQFAIGLWLADVTVGFAKALAKEANKKLCEESAEYNELWQKFDAYRKPKDDTKVMNKIGFTVD